MIEARLVAVYAISVACVVVAFASGAVTLTLNPAEPHPGTEVTWQNVSCTEGGVCVADAEVDVPDGHEVVLLAPTNYSATSENVTTAVDYRFSGDAAAPVMVAHTFKEDVYAYEVTDDGEWHLVGAYDFGGDGNVTEVEPEDPPFPQTDSRTSAGDSS